MPHPKLRPVDLANEGEYLAGLAHSPRFIDETVAHAKAVAVEPRPFSRAPSSTSRDRWPRSIPKAVWPAPPA
jgi:heterodisulfide reductase subunit A-like polyferredoxin